MKKVIFLMMMLASFVVYAKPTVSKSFFECSGFAGVDEYRVGINLKTKKAGFFDNDTTSYLRLTKSLQLESLPPQIQYIFEGKDKGSPGTLELIFNYTTKKANLISKVNKTEESMGTVSCQNAVPWEDLN